MKIAGSPLVEKDSLLAPFAARLQRRYQKAVLKECELCHQANPLSDSCNNHLYYGLHATDNGWVFREKAPNAQQVFIYGDFSYWKIEERFALRLLGNGDWEIELPRNFLTHGMLYKLWMVWLGGAGERIPAYARRVVQDETTKIFSAQVWQPETPYCWQHPAPPRPNHPLVYEAHIGMAAQKPKIGTYTEFREQVLPRITALGYNTLQLMAIQEHPYYGSFGYQVANLFAPSSRFGTPEELRQLIDEAHARNLIVILDVVHSHAVANEREGLARFDGSETLYFHADARGTHPIWHSRCFDYAKNETLTLLLSNLKYWLDDFHFDGFRFDGVTSMCYHDHGIGVDFVDYAQYFDENVDEDALTYLFLANRLVHQLKPAAITIAEDVSGIPGLAFPTDNQGVGFDFRLAMGVADFWTTCAKNLPPEQWHVGDIFYRLTDKRNEETVISYAESHDQAMVGDQTLLFRLLGSKMYEKMSVLTPDWEVDRAIALHKLIVFSTLALSDGGFLNFMGNEFGHPEWIDFPREGNQWSYQYARRQWNLVDDKNLKYKYLQAFHTAVVHVLSAADSWQFAPTPLVRDNANQLLAFQRGNLLFIFNFNLNISFTDYEIPCKSGEYKIILHSDMPAFGGFNRIDTQLIYPSKEGILRIYQPAGTATIFQLIESFNQQK